MRWCSAHSAMKSQLALLLLVLLALAHAQDAAAPPPSAQYSDKYAGVDLDAILSSDVKVNAYFECLMDRGVCSAGGADIKRILPAALGSRCARCNERQKATADKIIDFLIDKKPALWSELEQRYDPAGNYRTNNGLPALTA